MFKMKRVVLTALFFALLLTYCIGGSISADMPVQDNTAIGQAYDGVNFDELIGNRVYFGAMNQMNGTKYHFYGKEASSYESNPTPILWRVMGEDGSLDGTTTDRNLALFSEYVIDASKFSGMGKMSWSHMGLMSGEADYHVSFVNGWLNNEYTYKYQPFQFVLNNPGRYGYEDLPARIGFGNSFKITESDTSISYDAELNSIGRSTVDTYAIMQGDGVNHSEVVIDSDSPGDMYQYVRNHLTTGEWTSYFASGVIEFRKWPVTEYDAIAYIPFGLSSYTGLPSHRKVFWNSNGLPKTSTSVDYSIGEVGDDIYIGRTKYKEAVDYWLRNPDGSYAQSDSGYTYIVTETGLVRLYSYSRDSNGIRPITKLIPENVIMTHLITPDEPVLSNQIQEDKTDDSFWNYADGDDGINNYKLTLVSDKVQLNSLKNAKDEPIDFSTVLEVEEGKSITVKSDDYIGDYLAYKIVRSNADGSREIVAYGTSKGDTPDVLEIQTIKSTIDNTNLETGEYTLYVWAQGEDEEGLNATTVHSYEGSNPQPFTFNVVEEKKITYKVIYDGNGETGGTAPVDAYNPYTPGYTVTILNESDLSKEEYEFIGWNTKRDGSGISYSADDVFDIHEDVYLYAQWKKKTVVEPEKPDPTPEPDPDPDPVDPEKPIPVDPDPVIPKPSVSPEPEEQVNLTGYPSSNPALSDHSNVTTYSLLLMLSSLVLGLFLKRKKKYN